MADETLSFVIEQISGKDRKKVVLTDHDAPFGSPRKQAMFRLGGRNERNLIRLDGRPSPIVHSKHTVWHPSQIKGHLRDHFTGDDGHARETGEKLLDILDDQRLVKLSCGGIWTWIAYPENFDVDVEGVNDFAYDLRFDVLQRPGYKPPEKQDENLLPYPTDVAAEVQALLTEQRAQLLAQQIAVDVMEALVLGFDALDSALDEMRDVATAFENAPAKADAEARAMSAKAQEVKDRCDDIAAILSSADPASMLTATAADAVAQFQADQFAAELMLDECKVRMRALQYTARQRLTTTDQVYVVGPGDSLESIAEDKLGTQARAYDLGLRPRDLRVGRQISIPK